MCQKYLQFGGCHPRTVKNLPDGTYDIEELKAAIREEDQHFPRTGLVGKETPLPTATVG